MGNLIITVGRENGSGGRHVGELLAKELGIAFYDKKLLEETAKTSGYDKDFIAENEEKKPSVFWGAGSFYSYDQPISTKLFIMQSNAIKEIADHESCVIVGRCADYVLADYDNVVNIFIHAPIQTRIKRIVERDKIPEDKAKSYISKNDKSRAAYYNYFSNKVWGSAKNYHLSIDTEQTGIEGTLD